MPTYEYKCQKCGEDFEVFKKISDDPVTACIKCGGEVKQIFHPVGIIFKGSGFYTTDYKRKSTEPAKADTKPETKPETKSETKPETKPKKEEKVASK